MKNLTLFYWLLPLVIVVAGIPEPVFGLTSSSSPAVQPIPITSNNKQASAQALKTTPKTSPTIPKAQSIPPVIIEFGANPSTIGYGDNSNISWNVSNATSVTIYPALGFVAPQGNIILSPSFTTTYTLTGTNDNTTITTTITITVTDRASPTPAPPSPPIEASALCNDGTYSYYDHQSGCCSHHGGVKRWINKPPF